MSEGVQKSNMGRAVCVMTTFWLFAVLVLSNCYKGVMKSNYVFQPTYSTVWKSIRDMQNFSFIFAFELPEVNGAEEASYLKSISRDACEKFETHGKPFRLAECLEMSKSAALTELCFYGMAEFDVHLRFACAFFYNFMAISEADSGPEGQNYAKWLQKYRHTLGNVVARGRIIEAKKLEKVIRTELTKPRTAFVTFSEHVEADWVVFEKVMEDSPVRFVLSQEESWNFNVGFAFSSGFNHNIGNWLWQKVSRVMEAGFYNLWIHWERARSLHTARKANKRERPKAVMKLSFTDSDVHLIFMLYGLCIAAAVVVLSIELVTILQTVYIFEC